MMSSQVKTVFLVEPDEEILFANIVARGRGITGRPMSELRTEARAKWLYGQWLTEQASHYSLPVLEPRQWDTLAERIVAYL